MTRIIRTLVARPYDVGNVIWRVVAAPPAG